MILVEDKLSTTAELASNGKFRGIKTNVIRMLAAGYENSLKHQLVHISVPDIK